MKLAVIIAFGFFAVAHAGVGILTPQEEADVLQLYWKLCNSGRSEGGDLGGARVWCKLAPGADHEIVNHNVEVPSISIPDNIVFVQPPPRVYKHNVAIQGGTSVGGRVKIYVLPSKSSHSITSQYNPGSVVTSKPSVYYLKSNGDEGYRYGTPAPTGVAGYAK